MRQPSIRHHRVLCLIVLAFLLSGVCVAGQGVAGVSPEIAIAPIPGAAPAADPAAPADAAAGEVPAGEIGEDAFAMLPGGAELPLASASVAPPSAAAGGWQTLLSDSFEGVFPAPPWGVYDGNGLYGGELYWDDVSYRAHSGSRSVWAAAGGDNALDPATSNCPNDMDAWMVSGPYSLTGATAGTLQFYYWNLSEQAWDYFGWYVSINGSNFYGTRVSGDSLGWQQVILDLSAVPTLGDVTGLPTVWIAFRYTSDNSVTSKGSFVDDVLLQAYVPEPNLTPYTPLGWPYPVVPSSVPGTNTVDVLRTTAPTFVDWAVENHGDGAATAMFDTCLYLDGGLLRCWGTGPLPPGYMGWIGDWPMDVTPTPGEHTLRLVADVDNTVIESDETDNAWERTFVWQGPRVYLSLMLH